MGRRVWLALGGIGVVGFGWTLQRALSPRIRVATWEEIAATLPPELRLIEPSRPEDEARARRLLATADEIGIGSRNAVPYDHRHPQPWASAQRSRLAEIDRIVASGALWAGSGQSVRDRLAFYNLPAAYAWSAYAAEARADSREAVRLTLATLRCARALLAMGGSLAHRVTARRMEMAGALTALRLQARGKIDRRTRDSVLGLIPEERVPDPELALAARREGEFAVIQEVARFQPSSGVGTYDPLATARLVGRIYVLAAKDARLPAHRWREDGAEPLRRTAEDATPRRTDARTEAAQRACDILYQCRMNLGANTLGNAFAARYRVSREVSEARGAEETVAMVRAVLEAYPARRTRLDADHGGNAVELDALAGTVSEILPDGKRGFWFAF